MVVANEIWNNQKLRRDNAETERESKYPERQFTKDYSTAFFVMTCASFFQQTILRKRSLLLVETPASFLRRVLSPW